MKRGSAYLTSNAVFCSSENIEQHVTRRVTSLGYQNVSCNPVRGTDLLNLKFEPRISARQEEKHQWCPKDSEEGQS